MARPKGAGIQCDRTDGKFEILVKEENAWFVIGGRARALAGSLREDDDFPALGSTVSRLANHLAERRWPELTLNGNELEFPAKCAIKRDGQKLRLHHQRR